MTDEVSFKILVLSCAIMNLSLIKEVIIMNNIIDLTRPVAEVVKEHPEIKAILVDLGFKPLAQATMLNTVGKVTSLKAGAKLANVSLDKIQKVLEFNGYEVIGGNND